ncbi:MAG: DUF4346 domain-containing protein [Candidatus Thermoplasmatota archaeon]
MVEVVQAAKRMGLCHDPSGFFVIFLDREEIVVEHYLNVRKGGKVVTGRLNKIVRGRDAEALCHTIVREELVSRLDHAAYLGCELQKAEIALRKGLKYEQDELLCF